MKKYIQMEFKSDHLRNRNTIMKIAKHFHIFNSILLDATTFPMLYLYQMYKYVYVKLLQLKKIPIL